MVKHHEFNNPNSNSNLTPPRWDLTKQKKYLKKYLDEIMKLWT